MQVIKETTYKGTQILFGNEKRDLIDKMVYFLKNYGFTEIQIPIIQFQETFDGKVGKENNNLMFNFSDRGGRRICLAPEYTAVVQKLANTTFKDQKDVKLFYVAECFRGEKPQAGRFRQFTQLGVEILNPSQDYNKLMLEFAEHLVMIQTIDYEVNKEAKRGLDYYVEGQGFEISVPSLGSSKQVVGGGAYDGGIGFAVGIDRLMLVKS